MKYNTQIVKDKIKILGHNQYIPINFHYKNEKTKFLMYHKQCGKTYSTYWSTFQAGTRCPYCNGKFRPSKTFIKNKINNSHNHEYKLLLKGPYKNAHQKLPILHKPCNNIIYMDYNHFKKGEQCKYCYAPTAVHLTIPRMKKRVWIQGHHQYIVLEKDNRHIIAKSKIKIKHLKCGHIYKVSCSNWTNGNRCPYCQASHGEIQTGLYLQKHNIFYKYSYHTNCYLSNTAKENGDSLHLDFYLPKYKIGIEYDGVQHFHPVNHFGGIKIFKRTHKRDLIKDKWCKHHHIKLIRIDYPYKNQHSKFSNKVKQNIINTLNKKLLPLIKK